MKRLWLVLLSSVTLAACTAAPSGTSTPPSATTASPNAAPSSSAAPSPSVSVVPSPSAVASAVAAANTGSTGRPLTQITVTHLGDTPSAIWLRLAQDKGIFARNGLQVDDTVIGNPNAAIAALVSGQVQMAINGGPPAMAADAGGSDLEFVAVTTPIWNFLLMGGPDIHTIQDLVGKTVGVPSPGSTSEIAMRELFVKYGLPPDSATMFYTGTSANKGPALASGQVAAVTLSPPDDLALVDMGYHVFHDVAQDKMPGVVGGQVVSRSYANQHRDVIQSLVDSQVEAEALLHNDRDLAISEMEKYDPFDDPRSYDDAYDYYYGNPNTTPILPYPRLEQFVSSQQTVGQQNPAVLNVDLSQFFDPSFVQSAADRGLD